MALFHEDLKRNCNVAALSICDILRINTTQIKAVLDENPALHRPTTVWNRGCDHITFRDTLITPIISCVAAQGDAGHR